MTTITGNHLLDGLSRQDFERLDRHLKPVWLHKGDILCDAGRRILHGYFCAGAAVSTVGTADDGQMTEGGLIGREGLVGLPIILGDANMAHAAVVQMEGAALRIAAPILNATFDWSGTFRNAVLRYTQYYLTQVTQTAVCNRTHTMDARLARWLLMARDASGSSQLGLTHEGVAQMLGVHRPGVSMSIGALKEMGVLECGRGQITILKPNRLIELSCGCYKAVRFERDRLLGLHRPVPDLMK